MSIRRFLIISILGVLLVAGAWTALWAYGAHEADRQADAWLASEAAQGRQWTCPGRTIAGYPFALTLSCRGATFAGDALGLRVEGSVAAASARVSVLHPSRMSLTLAPPFTYRSSDGTTNVRGGWTRLRVDLERLPSIGTVTVDGADLTIEGVFGPQGTQHLGASQLRSRIDLPSADPDPTVGFDIDVSGTDVPALDTLVGDTQPTELHVIGQIDAADVGDARTPEEAMDRWRRAQGHIDLTSTRVSHGLAHVTATGTLHLDDAHRPEGHLEAAFVGVEPILRRYGLDPHLAAAGALLSSLFGGGARTVPPEPGAITLPINLQEGELRVGPVGTDVRLLPLY